MCGIAGSFHPHGPVALARRGWEIAARLRHRGPDAQGDWISADGRAQLVHTRLSIIDVGSRSNQPFVRGTTVLVFNGEVYNFRALKRELAAVGQRFITDGDTEVIAAGFEAWGSGVFQRLRGMYAIAIYEPDKPKLTLARDAFGIKPLYYECYRGELRFASEIKALVLDHVPELNEPTLWDLATFGFHFDHQSVFSGIAHLPPGQVLEATAGIDGLRLVCNASKRLGEPAGNDHPRVPLREVLAESVRDHLVADVPVATSLSGGLDSSIVTVLARRQTPTITAYTNSFGEAADPEVLHARLLCQKQNIPLRVLDSRIDDAESFFERVCWHLEEPVPNIAFLTSFFLGGALRADGYKVVLVGEGADELLAGYPWHTLPLQVATNDDGRALFRAYAQRRCQRPPMQWLRPAAARGLADRSTAQEAHFAQHFAEAERSPLARFLAFDQRYQLERSQLFRVDRMFMAHAIEARVPYLYDSVAALAGRLPDRELTRLPPRAAWQRWLARRQPLEKIALRKVGFALLPKAIAAREKFGKQGTLNLHQFGPAAAVSSFFKTALTAGRYAASREALGEWFDWTRIENDAPHVPAKAQLFFGLLLGTVAHALNGFRLPEESVARSFTTRVTTDEQRRAA